MCTRHHNLHLSMHCGNLSFGIHIVNDNGKWPLFLKIVPGGVCWPLHSMWKCLLVREKKKFGLFRIRPSRYIVSNRKAPLWLQICWCVVTDVIAFSMLPAGNRLSDQIHFNYDLQSLLQRQWFPALCMWMGT